MNAADTTTTAAAPRARYTLREVEVLLGISRRAIISAVGGGWLKAAPIDGSGELGVSEADLARYVAGGPPGAARPVRDGKAGGRARSMKPATRVEKFTAYTLARGYPYPVAVDVPVSRSGLDRLPVRQPLPSGGLTRCFDHAFIAGKYFGWGPSAQQDEAAGTCYEWCIVTEPYLNGDEPQQFIRAMAAMGVRVECLGVGFHNEQYPAYVVTLTDPAKGWPLFAELGRCATLGDASAFLPAHLQALPVPLPA